MEIKVLFISGILSKNISDCEHYITVIITSLMKKQVVLVVLQYFADWEAAYLSNALNNGPKGQSSLFDVKYATISDDKVKSSGGMTIIPDYKLGDIPEDISALAIIGGINVLSEEAKMLKPLVSRCIESKIPVGGICNGSIFLGACGFLNNVRHTSNDLGFLQSVAGDAYTGSSLYLNEQAVCDGGIVTANGSATLEFTREMMILLGAGSREDADAFYQFHKVGAVDLMKTEEGRAVINKII